ncbi:hypothetical protein [Porphyrobacter sp. HT-58-2]|uniref:hypothetical protein n=1 Tax=Porphyrobacter sp. HT-58-2 TaxID=2023229 RepID=UPI0011B0D4DB|nr:hypothetical protein [Porphyrobacter sp. HT-58-2]
MRTLKLLPAAVVAITTSGLAQNSTPLAEPMTIDELAISTHANEQSGASYTPLGTVTKSAEPLAGRKYLTPTKATSLPDVGGKEVSLVGMPSADILKKLSLVDERVTIERIDKDGRLTSVVGSVAASKGTYRVNYYYYRYTIRPCTAGNITEGGIAIGIGLRLTADITTTKSSLNIGGPMPLAVAASQNRAKGSVRVQSFGVSSGSAALSPYLSSSGDLSTEALKKAMESFGVIRAVTETGSLTAEPYHLFVESGDIGKCLSGLVPK